MKKKQLGQDEQRAAHSSDAGAVLGLVFEFLGFLGGVPLLGFAIDHYWLNPGGGPRWGFAVGLAVGFIYGLIHLYRRARVFMQRPGGGYQPPKSESSREGYTNQLDARLKDVESGLTDVGRKIDSLHSSRRKPDELDSPGSGDGV